MSIVGAPLPFVLTLLVLLVRSHSVFSYPTPMNCTDTSRLCTSFLAFKPQPNQTLALIQSMFDVLPSDITVEEGSNGFDYLFIRKNCSCLSTSKQYATNTTFTVRSNEGFVNDMALQAYDGLAFLLPNTTRRPARVGAVVSLRLFCGCSSGLWNYLTSYVLKDGDSVESLASRFGVSMDSIEQVNGIENPDNVTVGALYYIPLNSVLVCCSFFTVVFVVTMHKVIDFRLLRWASECSFLLICCKAFFDRWGRTFTPSTVLPSESIFHGRSLLG
ncbi:LysM domain receptor-like kinase 3 [Morella rubra]|uniref:LysM domain receptor-like kinase 3 n=1 Tax=Morella rubra TaxID=262757 RepID=A0A6A1W308_9ROSI|nr:LysM domain receptor-like kinase 3 [Morella rubra]